MINTLKLFGIIVFVAVIGFTMTGCAITTMAGAHTDHGLFSGFSVESTLTQNDYQKIASYTNILWLFDSGYEDYVSKVKAAEKANKKIAVVTVNYFYIIGKYTAYTLK